VYIISNNNVSWWTDW